MLHQIVTRLFLAFLIVALALPVLQAEVAFAQAAGLSSTRLDDIRRHCSSAQISLQQLRKRDAVSRINRGRAYDQLMAQIAAFNSRLAYNNLSLPQLTVIARELQTHIDQFRSLSDKQYLDHLESAIKLNCKDHPAEFYNFIVLTREDRDKIASEISKIDELIASYRGELALYQATLPEAGSPGVGQ